MGRAFAEEKKGNYKIKFPDDGFGEMFFFGK